MSSTIEHDEVYSNLHQVVIQQIDRLPLQPDTSQFATCDTQSPAGPAFPQRYPSDDRLKLS